MKNELEGAWELVSAWVFQYLRDVEKYPVLSQARPGDLLRGLPCSPPEEPEAFDTMMRDFEEKILPGITHWQHPKFFGYFPANSSPPSLLAEVLTATMGVQAMSWLTSPAATELELGVMDWMRQLFSLPESFRGVIQDSASSATMVAMIVARERATDFEINRRGFCGERLVAYCSEEAHSSIEKAARMIGIGSEGLRKISVNHDQTMQVEELERAIQEDLAAGKTPFFVVGAFGTTSTTALDSLDCIAVLAQRYSLWFHVDAAYAGSALILPEIRALAKGIEQADSVVINPHKWLMTNFDCSAFFLKDKEALLKTFSLLPEYLKSNSDLEGENLRDWGPGLGRRFRALKLWFVLRWYGRKKLQSILREHIRLAGLLEDWVRADERFEIMAARSLNLVCFRLRDGNEATQCLMSRLNSSGKMFLSSTKIGKNFVLRLVVGQTHVSEKHLQEAWVEIQRAASETV